MVMDQKGKIIVTVAGVHIPCDKGTVCFRIPLFFIYDSFHYFAYANDGVTFLGPRGVFFLCCLHDKLVLASFPLTIFLVGMG